MRGSWRRAGTPAGRSPVLPRRSGSPAAPSGRSPAARPAGDGAGSASPIVSRALRPPARWWPGGRPFVNRPGLSGFLGCTLQVLTGLVDEDVVERRLDQI